MKWLRELVLIRNEELTRYSSFLFLLGMLSMSFMHTIGLYYKFFTDFENIFQLYVALSFTATFV